MEAFGTFITQHWYFAIPMFLLVNTGLFLFIIATIAISYAVCQNSLAGAQGAWFPELFQAKTRASGASLAYQISANTCQLFNLA